MKVIYVSGPYTAGSNKEIESNIKRARVVAENLWARGWAVICPHLNTAKKTVMPYETYLAGDMAILARCDAIYMMIDWLRSGGAIKEQKYASDNGIFIMYEANND